MDSFTQQFHLQFWVQSSCYWYCFLHSKLNNLLTFVICLSLWHVNIMSTKLPVNLLYDVNSEKKIIKDKTPVKWSIPLTQDPFAFCFDNNTWRVSCVQHFLVFVIIATLIRMIQIISRSWNFNDRRFQGPLIKIRSFSPTIFCFTGSSLLKNTTTILKKFK